MPTFLLKTEPSDYSFADLVREHETTWSGVRNPAALIAIRTMKKGDHVLVYHTGDEKAIVGLAKVVNTAYEDPANPGRNQRGEPAFAVVDLAPVKAAEAPVPLMRIKADTRFSRFGLVKQVRLSAMPVPPDLAKILREWAGF
jgi:predicted RNA-binding protein with PUA-like domain